MPTDIRKLVASYVAAYNGADWDGLAEHVTADYIHHSGEQTLDFDGFVRGATWLRAGFPDFSVEVLDVLVDGDRAAVRFEARGTHEHSFFGEAPTMRTVVLDGITVYRVSEGGIAEDWEAMDEQQLRRQLA
jgi:predicted ester cyclase